MAIQSREEWTRECLDALRAEGRNGARSRSYAPVSHSQHTEKGRQARTPGSVAPLSTEDCLRTYPDLSAHCLSERLDLPLRLWYLWRQANGRGWLYVEDLYAMSCGNRRQTRAWVRSGAGTFWHRAGDRLYLHGLIKVCQALAVKPRKRPVYIARADIENLARFRAALFASWFADAGEAGRVITQARLAEIFGRTSRTLRTWAKTTGLGVTHNMALADVPKPGDDLDKYPTGTLETLGWGKSWSDDPSDKPNLVWFERHDDNLMLVWKMANTYISTLATGPKTTLQKEAARHVPDNEAAGTPVKLYWRKDADGRKIAKAMQRKQAVYLETDVVHQKTGDVLWSYAA